MKDTRQVIEDYLSSQLPDDERAAIEQRMAEDASFRQRVRITQAAQDAIKQYASERSDRTATRNALQQVRLRQRRQSVVLAAIAVVLALIVIALLLPGKPNEIQPQQESPSQPVPATPESAQAIADAYLKPYEVGALLGGETEGPGQAFRQLVTVYRQNQCAEVRQMAPALLAYPDYATETRLMLAYCLLAERDAAAAIAQLEQIPAAAADAHAAAQWYVALAYLQLEQISEARQRLEAIASSGNAYADEAEQLLTKLPPAK